MSILHAQVDWAWAQPTPADVDLNDIISANGMCIVVGDNGTILRSTDSGESWETARRITSADISQLKYRNSFYWAATSAGEIIKSSNGLDWFLAYDGRLEGIPAYREKLNDIHSFEVSPSTLLISGSYTVPPENEVGGISFQQTANVTLAIGNTGAIITRSGDNIPKISHILWDTSRFISVGLGSSNSYSPVFTFPPAPSEPEMHIGRTFNGSDWTIAKSTNPPYFRSIEWNGERYVAVEIIPGNNSFSFQTPDTPTGNIYTSLNGTDWSLVANTIGTISIRALRWTGSRFLAIDRYRDIIGSTDGLNWEVLHTGDNNQQFHKIEGDGTLLWRLSPDGLIQSSSDGLSWTDLSSPRLERRSTGSLSMNDIIWSGEEFIAAGTESTFLTSTDGDEWNVHYGIGNYTLHSIASNSTCHVAVGKDGIIQKSTDGQNWSIVSSGVTSNLYDVIWRGDRFVAIGSNGVLLTSVDGTNWQATTTGTLHNFRSVLWNGTDYVATTSSSQILTSSDGLDWNIVSSGNGQSLGTVAWNGSIYLAGGTSGTILRSIDLETWEQVRFVTYELLSGVNKPGDSVYELKWVGNQFVAACGKNTLTSSNGVEWDTHLTGVRDTIASIAANAENVVAVTAAAEVITSPLVDCVEEINFRQEIPIGNTTTLSVQISGNPQSMQWYAGRSGDQSNPVNGASSTSLTTPAIEQDSYYWLRVVGDRGVVHTGTAYLHPVEAPILENRPSDQYVAINAAAEFAITVTGEALIYQWYQGQSGDLSNPISDAKSDILTITNPVDDSAYWVRVSNVAGMIDSETVTVQIVETPPSIISFSNPINVLSGESVELAVNASGEALSYQWHGGPNLYNTPKLSNETNATLQIAGVYSDRYYRVYISNPAGGVWSERIKVGVIQIPEISAIDYSPIALPRAPDWIRVTAEGTNLSYQWYTGQSGDVSIPLFGQNHYKLRAEQTVGEVAYWVRIFNLAGYVDSPTVNLTALDIGEVLNSPELTFISNGWYGQAEDSYDAGAAMQTSSLENLEASVIRTSVSGRGTLKFMWKISSEEGYDLLRFYINGNEAITPISGELDWRACEFVLETNELHQLTWVYAKNSSTTSGADTAWLDSIRWIPEGVSSTSFEHWVLDKGLLSHETQRLADPDSDRLCNLLEFALGLDAAKSNTEVASDNTQGLPAHRVEDDQAYFTYIRPRNIPNIGYTVQMTSDLTNPDSWLDISDENVNIIDIEPDMQSVEVRMPAGATQFFRLNVEENE